MFSISSEALIVLSLLPSTTSYNSFLTSTEKHCDSPTAASEPPKLIQALGSQFADFSAETSPWSQWKADGDLQTGCIRLTFQFTSFTECDFPVVSQLKHGIHFYDNAFEVSVFYYIYNICIFRKFFFILFIWKALIFNYVLIIFFYLPLEAPEEFIIYERSKISSLRTDALYQAILLSVLPAVLWEFFEQPLKENILTYNNYSGIKQHYVLILSSSVLLWNLRF